MNQHQTSYQPGVLSNKILATIWLFNIAMENGPFIDGKPSISMGHGFHGHVTNYQRVFPLKTTLDFAKPLLIIQGILTMWGKHNPFPREIGVIGHLGQWEYSPPQSQKFASSHLSSWMHVVSSHFSIMKYLINKSSINPTSSNYLDTL